MRSSVHCQQSRVSEKYTHLGVSKSKDMRWLRRGVEMHETDLLLSQPWSLVRKLDGRPAMPDGSAQ